MRDLTRTRKQLMREVVQHKQRIQEVLEDANVKLASIVWDVFGHGGRRMLAAIIAGQTDAASSQLWAVNNCLHRAKPRRGAARQGYCPPSRLQGT